MPQENYLVRTEDEVREGCVDDDFGQSLEMWIHLEEIRILCSTSFVIIIMGTFHEGISCRKMTLERGQENVEL